MTVIAPVLVPAVVAGLVWLVTGQLWKRPPAPSLVWGGSMAVALSFAAGHWVLAGWPPFPPVTAIHSLMYAGLIAGAVGIAESFWGSHWASRWAVRAVLAGGAAWWQFNVLTEHTWSTAQAFGWLTAVTITVCMIWEALDGFAKRRAGFATPLLLWIVACATSVGLVFGASALLGQLAGCLAAACGAAIVLTIPSRILPLHSGAAGMVGFLLIGLLWQGYFYAELPLTSTALLILAPIVACTLDAWVPEKTRNLHRNIAVFGSLLLIVGIANGIAYLAYRTSALELGDYAY